MKKIALITNHDDDVYCFRKELLEELKKEGHAITISCPYGKKLESLGFEYKYDNPTIDRRGISPIKDLKLLIHYVKLFKSEKPDVVLTYTIKPNIYASIACRITKANYINNITGLGSILNKRKSIQIIVYKLLKIALKESKCVFFQNKTNMNLITAQGVVRGKYDLIPGSGVNIDRYPLQKYPKNNKKIVFNYIGRVLAEKGIDDYIEAAKIIKEKGYNTEFNIIGFIEPTEKHYMNDFKKLEKKGIVKYRGPQNDIRPYIRKSHAIIHPSKYGEGMSNVLLENASSGRPIITTNNPGCFETVDNGKTGYIYEKGNVTGLIALIEKFIKLPYTEKIQMGLSGRKKIEKEFNRKIVIKKYIKEINDCRL